jgi:hypothetical protein
MNGLGLGYAGVHAENISRPASERKMNPRYDFMFRAGLLLCIPYVLQQELTFEIVHVHGHSCAAMVHVHEITV